MGLDSKTANELASVLGEWAVLVYIGKRPSWLMMPSRYGTIDELASVAGMCDIYDAGELTILDNRRRPLKPRVKYNWQARQPLRLVQAEPG